MFKKNIFGKIVVGALMLSMVLPFTVMAEEPPMVSSSKSPVAAEKSENTTIAPNPNTKMPDSVLYYGTINKIQMTEDGKLKSLAMEGPKDGQYIIKISENTLFVDSGNRKNFDAATLKEGDRVYVFHSPMSTRSMPPQSEAFVVVNNIPMDAGCPMYHEVESIQDIDGVTEITSDNGETRIGISNETEILDYEGNKLTVADVKENGFIMAWYWDRGEDVLIPSHIMVVPSIQEADVQIEDDTLTQDDVDVAPIPDEDADTDAKTAEPEADKPAVTEPAVEANPVEKENTTAGYVIIAVVCVGVVAFIVWALHKDKKDDKEKKD